MEISSIKLINDGLQNELEKCIKEYHRNNIIQIIYLIIGIFALFISTLIDETIFKEIVLIGGWVLIWSLVESEIFSDTKSIKKRKIIKKILNSQIEENKIQ